MDDRKALIEDLFDVGKWLADKRCYSAAVIVTRAIAALQPAAAEPVAVRAAAAWRAGRVTCEHCYGEGFVPGSATQECKPCDGWGSVASQPAAAAPDAVVAFWRVEHDAGGEDDFWDAAKYDKSAVLARYPTCVVSPLYAAAPGASTQGSPSAQVARESVSLNLAQAQALLAVFGGEDADVTVTRANGFLYAHFTEYPEEGVTYLNDAALQGEQASRDKAGEASCVSTTEQCKRCGGTGDRPDAIRGAIPCPSCRITGLPTTRRSDVE